MAYQPKSYRKFLATSVTAAMVATAVAPVAALAADDSVITNNFKDVDKQKHAWAIPSIDYLVGKKAIEGRGNQIFDIHGNLTRAEAAAILVRTLDLDVDDKAKPNFSDTDGHWGAKYIAAIQNDLPGVIEGYQGKFNPNNNITRQELAKIIVEAYELELNEGADVDFPDNNGWGEDYVDILASNGIVEGKPSGNFAPNAYVSRGEATVFFHRTEVEDVRIKVPGVEAPLKVNSVSATNSTTLEIKGTGLDKLEADNIKVEGNDVTSVSANSDGTTATVLLDSALAVDEEVTVTVNGEDFKVTYRIEADKVAVLEATYDDDTKDQFVSFTVNGKNTSVTELFENGYDVEFAAYHGKGNDDVTSEVFKSTSTGEISDTVGADLIANVSSITEAKIREGEEIKVQITLTKGADVIVSELGKVTIKNVDLAANSITSHKLKDLTDDTIEYKNGVLVVGEEAKFTEIKVKTDNNEEKITEGYTVKSSNEGIVSVSNGTEIRAHAPGKANLTITYGGVTKVVAIEVKNDEREIDKVVVEKENKDDRITSIGAIKDRTVKVKVIALDQYGDEMKDEDFEAKIGDKSIISFDSAGSQGEATFTSGDVIEVYAQDNGRSTITFRDEDGYALPKSSIFTVNVTEASNVSKRTIEFLEVKDNDAGTYGGSTKSDFSKDATLDISDDYIAVLELKQFAPSNAELGDVDLNDAEVSIAQSKNGVIEDANNPTITNGKLVVKAGTEKGNATVTIKYDGKTYTQRLTVVDEGYTIKSVSFKSIPEVTYDKTLNYKTVLNVTEGSNDAIVKGINLSKSSSQPIRITDQGELYLDKDADGNYDSSVDGDLLGSLEIEQVGTFANSPTNVIDGFKTTKDDDGTVIFKVLDHDDKIAGSTSVKVDY